MPVSSLQSADQTCPRTPSATRAGALAWVNGVITPVEEAKVPILDRGFLFGDGVYELVRFFAGVGVQMEEHVARLERSLRASRIEGFDGRQMPRICDDLLAAAELCDASVYLQVTRGAASTRQHLPERGMTPTVVAIASALPPLAAFIRPEPVRAALVEDPRWRRGDIKTISLMGGILALLDAAEQLASPDARSDARPEPRTNAGSDLTSEDTSGEPTPGGGPSGGIEAILHRGGLISEGTATNVLVRLGEELVTPPVDGEPPILHGVTRLLVDGAARTLGRGIRHRPLTVSELLVADEIMVLSSRRIVGPVVALDGRPVGDGRPGPAALALFDAARQRIATLCGIELTKGESASGLASGSASDLSAPSAPQADPSPASARTPEIARP